MNNDNKVETAIAGLNCWASYATGHKHEMHCISLQMDYTIDNQRNGTGNVGKIANVADATSVMRPDTLYFGPL